LTASVLVRDLWQFILVWGIVLGIAASVTPSLPASVASRWFVRSRGLVLGILANANAAGQVIFLPVMMAIIVGSGWRAALMLMVGASLVLLPLVWLWMRDHPADIDLEPYGAGKDDATARTGSDYRSREFRLVPMSSLSEVFRSSTFWLLSACFFVCGATANGLIGTHLIPHAIERGIPEVTAATVFGIMGVASFVGTTYAGWLVDRIDPRKVLAAAYALRGSSLIILPYVSEAWGLFVFAVMYGLDWFATGPPTTTMLARSFGSQRVGTLFGFVFVFHQLGGALAAVGAGWMRVEFGDYEYAFLIGAVLGLAAAGLALMIRPQGTAAPALPAVTELANA
jgi:sugar phosphate permease